MEPANKFSYEYYRTLLKSAQARGFNFMTLREYIRRGMPEKSFIIRHDFDMQPSSLEPLLFEERKLGIRSTIFVRVAGAPYNFMSYQIFKTLKEA
jgi:hypothetical protein